MISQRFVGEKNDLSSSAFGYKIISYVHLGVISLNIISIKIGDVSLMYMYISQEHCSNLHH